MALGGVDDMAVAEAGREASADSSGSGASAPTASAQAGAGTGGTNTVVQGVDEIDVIDRMGDRLLVSRNGALALVDLDGRRVVAELRGLPYDARISAGDGVVFAAGTSNTGTGIEVARIRVDGDRLVDEGRWTAPGYLLDARRTGDRLHVVAVDMPFDAIPFAGGPVPCEDVWRPVAPATTPAATLVATLPAGGSMAPTALAEVTGSGGNILVTQSSVYLATESYGTDGTVTTGLHRFDVDTLALTGSGVVPGSVAGRYALDEHEGTLRVATNAGSGGFIGRPMPVEGDVIVEDMVEPAASAGAERSAAGPSRQDPPVEETTTTVPEETTTTVPEETTTTTAPEETTTTVPEETTTTVPETTTTTVVEDPEALAEVFVFDTEGDLDLLGRSGRFGHDFETIHGVRFVGDVAYVVTFLQTDPFWVIDLADPAAPRIVGELQIPGFSGYLHPVDAGLVVGFGPDGNGAVSARLFDVADPTAPSVRDEIRLGDDSPVVFDPHAFVGMGDARFAVPVGDYPDEVVTGECATPVPIPEPLPADQGGGDGSTGGADPAAPGAPTTIDPVPPCEVRYVGGGAGAVELEVGGGRLRVVDRQVIEDTDLYAERVVQASDGTWFVLSWDRLAGTDGSEVLLPAG
jgi:uncharacterized secreted protein with C-terminal beta-propeller domain